VFFKQPIRIAGGGMFFAPVLIPYNDTAETVGAGRWHVGASWASSSARRIAPKDFNADDIFIDVNDFGFAGFGDTAYLGAINGNWRRIELDTVMGITNFLDIGARLPMIETMEYAVYDSQEFIDHTKPLQSGFKGGDVELWAKMRVFSSYGNYLRAAIRADWRLPTGSVEDANSLGRNQFALSYIVSAEPTMNVVANWTTGVTVVDGDIPFLKDAPFRLRPVYFTGFSSSYRINDNFAVFGQLDTHTSPYAEMSDVGLDIFGDPSSIFTLGGKVHSKYGLMDVGVSRGLSRSAPDFGLYFNVKSNTQLNAN
jgi:hypothetical protein